MGEPRDTWPPERIGKDPIRMVVWVADGCVELGWPSQRVTMSLSVDEALELRGALARAIMAARGESDGEVQ